MISPPAKYESHTHSSPDTTQGAADTPTILTINSGSSSLKACLFSHTGDRHAFRYEHLQDPRTGFHQLLSDLSGRTPDIIGHRLVHGGDVTDAARLIDDAERARLESCIHLAPLHLPGNLLGVDLCRQRFNVPQIACFDTAFHATLPELATRLPIPRELGLRRFGFHGLNYAHIASCLPSYLGNSADGKIIVAHLGSGASLCLLEKRVSVDTTMGYTPAGGITMGTRSGDLDPGVMVELAKHHDSGTLTHLVFHKMGLIALSDGESSEMSELSASDSPQAKFAVAYFCNQVRGAIGSLAAKAGGIDALVFTGGIGENAAAIRKAICDPLHFIGFTLNIEANLSGATRIEHSGSKPILIIPADEEGAIRRHCLTYTSTHRS